jgi:hypothetical protein
MGRTGAVTSYFGLVAGLDLPKNKSLFVTHVNT